MVALKKTRLEMEEEGVPSTALREVSLLQMLSLSMYIVRIFGIVSTSSVQVAWRHMLSKLEGRVCKSLRGSSYEMDQDAVVRGACGEKRQTDAVFEYMDTDLKNYIDSYGRGPSGKPYKLAPNPLAPRLSFMYQLCTGLAHCHGHGVMHRDLKPLNLLGDKQMRRLEITDLGLGRAFTVPMRSYTHELSFFGGRHCSELQLHILRLLGTPNETVWPGVSRHRDWHEFPQWTPLDLSSAVLVLSADGLDLLAKMLVYEPSKKISAKSALNHPYFKDVNKSAI